MSKNNLITNFNLVDISKLAYDPQYFYYLFNSVDVDKKTFKVHLDMYHFTDKGIDHIKDKVFVACSTDGVYAGDSGNEYMFYESTISTQILMQGIARNIKIGQAPHGIAELTKSKSGL